MTGGLGLGFLFSMARGVLEGRLLCLLTAGIENNRFGSVAAQMIATFMDFMRTALDQSFVIWSPLLALDLERTTTGRTALGVLDVGVIKDVFVPGSVVDNDQNAVQAYPHRRWVWFWRISILGNYIKTKMVSRVSGSGIPSQQEIFESQDVPSGADDVTSVVYVLSGPFFTGSIALNPIVSTGLLKGALTKSGDSLSSFEF